LRIIEKSSKRGSNFYLVFSPIQAEPKKSEKKTKPENTAKTIAPAQPDFKLDKSENDLSDLLKSGC